MGKRLIAFILLSISLFIMLVGCEKKDEKEKTLFLYDTIVTIKLETKTSIIDEVINEVENILTKYSNLSDNFQEYSGINNIYTLNKKRTVELSSDLIELINYSLAIKDETNGAFNPLIGGLSLLYKDIINDEKLPSNFTELVELELAKMNNSSIQINGNLVTINGDANIDLGGISKGFALEKVKDYLKEKGVTNYLVNAGSSSIIFGEKNTNKGYYNVGMKYDEKKILKVKNKTLGTSSIIEQNVTINDQIYHHIINPFTGFPTSSYQTIYLIGDSPALIDALTTAYFSMSLDEIKSLSKTKLMDVIIYQDDKIIFNYSSGDYYG